MIPIQNKRVTPFDIGDLIQREDRSILGRRYYLTRHKYKIIGISLCSDRPCDNCSSGNMAYTARKFNKRLGRENIRLCPAYGGGIPGEAQWIKVEND